MKQYHVYELFDQSGTIVYVGMTSDPKMRFTKHIKAKPGYGNGKFYGRTDLDIRILSIHSIKKEAALAEGAHKLSLGMNWTERDSRIKIGKKIGIKYGPIYSKIMNTNSIICEYCNKELNSGNYSQYHGPNCKLNPLRQVSLV